VDGWPALEFGLFHRLVRTHRGTKGGGEVKRSIKPTDLGIYILLCPNFDHDSEWFVHCFSLAGNWTSSGRAANKAAAIKEKRKLFAHHKKLAAQRAKGKRR
jgi:hypothetical protein